MTVIDNPAQRRELQQDAHAWAKFTSTNYTAALRQMRSPLARGLLGTRLSARALIATVDHHSLVGSRGGVHRLGDSGYLDSSWHFNGKTDYIELALIADMLRMFTPVDRAEGSGVNSYALKHTAEEFLSPHFSYVSNGQLIWAAAALDLPIRDIEEGRLNLSIGLSELEHEYVRRTLDAGRTPPQAHHHRPPGYEYLRNALDQLAAGSAINEPWARPTPPLREAPFHEWLIRQADRDDLVGTLATDYAAGIRDSDHQIAYEAGDLLTIFSRISHSPEAYDAVTVAISEWLRSTSDTRPVRTERLDIDSHEHSGWGAGSGTVERYEYRCPCGAGTIVEEHDNIPGFREHDVWIMCEPCRQEWRFAAGRSTHDWSLEPLIDAPAA